MKIHLLLSTLLIQLTTAGIIELVDNESNPEQLFSKFEFVVIDYYDPLSEDV